MYNEIMSDRRSINGRDPIAFCTFHSFLVEVQNLMKLGSSMLKGAVSRNSAKLGNYKMPVKLKET